MAAAQAVAQALEPIGRAAAFVSQRSASAGDLPLNVEGVGRIHFPISPATARKLIKQAQPARHGYKDETRLDRSVRDTFEIGARRITIGGDAWQRRLRTQLEHIRRDLGLPEGYRLRAELHNLLIYGPGQFFVSHQDSEKVDAMVGSLVVGLPSSFSGGTMVIEHHGEQATVRGSASKLTFTAFYADCQHQVRAVKQGYRLALTYNLLLEGQAEPTDTPTEALAALTERVRTYFASPLPSRWKRDGDGMPPSRLIYLLDHQYTQRGLDWTRLKGGDGPRAAALQQVAVGLDCEVCLALVDVHETWDCNTGFDAYGAGWRGRRYRDEWLEDVDEDENDEAEPAEAHQLTDLIDSDATLRHFVAAKGKVPAMPGDIDLRELCYTKPSADFDPFESEYEGYMGNYGNTMERWYHRAAVVLWPRNRSFVLRAKVEPRWALSEVAKTLKSRDATAAADQARSLLPFWEQAVRQAGDNRLFERTLAVAADLDAPALAEALLTPFSLPQFKARVAPHWRRCLEHYGLAWWQAVLAHWLPHPHSHDSARMPWITAELPGLSQALCEAAGSNGRDFSHNLLRQEWRWLGTQWKARNAIEAPPARDAELALLSQPLLALLDAAVRIAHSAVRSEILAALVSTQGDTPSTPALALSLLRAAQARPGTVERLGPLRAHWRQRLAAQLAQAPRREDDWSIDQPLSCRCKFCGELVGFLRDSKRLRYEWPLAEDHRKHVHRIIDGHALPVTHTTRRSGRPYVLLLAKTRELFTREAAQRRTWQQDLDWLVSSTDDA